MAQAGYSGKPLSKKLGFKAGFKIRLINAPENYFTLIADMPENVMILNDKKPGKDLVHYFTNKSTDLHRDIPTLRNEIFPNGMIWVSWPKKASKIKSDITEDNIRNIALMNGLVDVKICAVDETWSGLKLVVPLKERNNNH